MTRTSGTRRLDAAVAAAAGISRERARALVMAGKVRVDGAVAAKAGAAVAATARIDVEDDARFVSRGGEKLEKALDAFAWSVVGQRCLDVGASTGGFTDCLLQRGAASVTAVDVGYGQIAWRLRTDARVRVVERCNFRLADPAQLGAPFGFACADVSFIGLAKIAAKLRAALSTGGRLVALVKPQFEAGRAAVGKGGVVRDPRAQIEAIRSVATALAGEGFEIVALTHSPLRGPAGNIEFLIGGIAAEPGAARIAPGFDAAGVVRAAHEALAP